VSSFLSQRPLWGLPSASLSVSKLISQQGVTPQMSYPRK
jgi:hypothetical protein